MGQFGQQPAVGKATAVQVEEGQPQIQPGKATLVGGAPDAATTRQIGVRPPTPPEFAALDPDVIEKLWASRAHLRFFRGKPDEEFWDHVRAMGPADLHTIVVVAKSAKAAGVWSHMNILNGCYTNGSSYGLEFLGNPIGITASGWGKDFPQLAVRREHGGTAHDWYRQNTGAGNPGLHLGVDAGAGYNNVHIDPTNPMKGVSDGKPHLEPAPPGSMLPFVPVLLPAGQAIYDVGALAEHAAEIGFFGDSVKSKFKKPESPTQHYLRMEVLARGGTHATEIADLEDAEPSRMKHQARWAGLAGVIRAEAQKIKAAHAVALSLAMQDDVASKPALEAELSKAELAATNLWKALATLVRNLEDEAPGHSGDLKGFDHEEAWGPYAVEDGKQIVQSLQATRRNSTK